MSPIDVVENAIVDEFAGRITRADAISTIQSVLRVTAYGAEDLLTHAVAPRTRYQNGGDRAAAALRNLNENWNES